MINGNDELYDDNGHGTFITGIIGANSITSKYSGIDNKSNIIVIKALNSVGETTSIKILQAMQWVLENKQKYNIKVVCMSFGSVFDNTNDPLIFIILKLIRLTILLPPLQVQDILLSNTQS